MNLWSWSYLAGLPPPSFLITVIALRFFFCDVFFINWVIQVCLEIHFGYVWNKLCLGKVSKKDPLNLLIMIIPRRNKVKEAISIYQGLFCHDQVSSGNFLEFFNLWRNLQVFSDLKGVNFCVTQFATRFTRVYKQYQTKNRKQ